MPADVKVRRAEPAEADLVGALTEQVYRAGGFGSDDYAKVLRDGQSRVRDGIVLVAVANGVAADGAIVGTVTLALPGTPLAHLSRAGEAEVRMLAVDEAARGLGIASRLMAACETLARDEGLAAVILCTETGMLAAQRLYERRGYLRDPARDWQIRDVRLLVLGYSPVKAGLAFVPLAVGALTGNVAGVKLGAKTGPRFLVPGGMLVMAASFGLLTVVSADTGFAIPAIALGLLGLGAGVAMPAAIGALMSTIPPEKAGVGSALNDTIQQAGSALGIAILGSLLAAGYTRHMPAGAPAQARQSIAGALTAARGETGLVHVAREAYTASMSATFTVSAIAILAAALLATLVIRNTKPQPAPAPADEQALVA